MSHTSEDYGLALEMLSAVPQSEMSISGKTVLIILLHPSVDAAKIGTQQFKPAAYPDRQFIAKNCRVRPVGFRRQSGTFPPICAVAISLF
jgi:hypothetical protein